MAKKEEKFDFSIPDSTADAAIAGDSGANGERSGKLVTGLTKFLSTVSGGGLDYVDAMIRRRRGEDVDVDKVRAKYQADYEANPGSAMIGGIAGTAAQAIPVARGLSMAGKLATAPGIIGGLKSGAQVGAGVGAFNEVARQADRLGSAKRAEEEFSLPGSMIRVGKEAVLGAGGGALGGLAGNLFTGGKGMIANLAEKPLGDRAIRAAVKESDDAAAMGVSGPGKLSAAEAARNVKDPVLRKELAEPAAGLEGLTRKASKDFTKKLLPAEEEALRFRGDLSKRVGQEATDATDAATKAASDAATAQAARQGIPRKQQLDVPGFWAVQGDPALKGFRDQVLKDQRDAVMAQAAIGPTMRGRPWNKAELTKLANKRHPSDTIGALEDTLSAATDPAIKSAAQRTLYSQSPLYQAADDAAAAASAAGGQAAAKRTTSGELDNLLSQLTRGNANVGQGPSKYGGGFVFGNTATLIRDLARAGKDALEQGAVAKAGRRNVDDPLEEVLRQIGVRTKKQRRWERGSYPVASGLLSNSGFLPE